MVSLIGLSILQTVERTVPVVGVSGRGLTNITDDDEKREYFDSPDELSRKVDKIVEWIRKSKHVIMFTGAGISTRFDKIMQARVTHSYTHMHISTHTAVESPTFVVE